MGARPKARTSAGSLLQRLAQHAGGDHAVDRAGQVRAVLLDRADRQHDHRVLAVGSASISVQLR
jgi:hypothetical protein